MCLQVKLDDAARAMLPAALVVAADVERSELLREAAALEALALGKGLSAAEQQRHAEVRQQRSLPPSLAVRGEPTGKTSTMFVFVGTFSPADADARCGLKASHHIFHSRTPCTLAGAGAAGAH